MSDKKKRRRSSHREKRGRYDDSSDTEESSSDSFSSTSSSSSSESSSSASSSEEEMRKRKKVKSRRMSKEKKRKDSKQKKKSKKAKAKRKRLGSKCAISAISMDDYYLRSAEFRTWLSKERKKFFSDLTSDQSRALFKKFVKKWNSGSLDQTYYHGIQSSAVGHSTQSNYQWKFSPAVKPKELQSMRESVSSWSSSKTTLGPSLSSPPLSESAGDFIGPTPPIKGPSRPPPGFSVGPSLSPDQGPRRIIGPSMGPPGTGDSVYERERAREMEQVRLKKERKDFRKQQELVLDELAPKATGRDAKIEKKRMRAEKRRERDLSPDLGGASIYGTSGSGVSSISSKVKARQEKRQNRAVAATQRISDYQAREKAKVEAILEMAKAHKKEGALW